MGRCARTSVVILCLSAAGPLRAQDNVLRHSPFRGALVPAGAIAGDADATSLETNPGQLGLLDGASWALVVDHWKAARVGRGSALLVGTPLFLGLTLGAGVQWLRPTVPPQQPADYGKFSLGAGLRLSRALGLGFAWEHLMGSVYGGRDSFTAGGGLRLHPRLALGLAVRDLARPRVPSDDPMNPNPRLPREWEGELAVRPFGTDRVEAAIAGRLEEGAGQPVRPRGRLSLRLRRGFTLFGEVDTARDKQPGNAPDGRDRPDVIWTALAGLTVDLGRLGVSVAGVAIPSESFDGSDDVGTGGSLVLRAYPGRRPPAIALRYVERVKMRGLENDGSFLQMVLRLRRLADDPSVGGVLLDIQGLDAGLGRTEELRVLVEALRRRKPVFAQVSSPSMREYYLASACDRIAIHPAGQLTVAGLAQTVTFYKGTLDRLGVKVELVRIAEYKGAMEPFVMNEQSEPVRQNRNALLDEQYSRIVEGIARGRAPRGLKVESIPALVDRAMFRPADAQKHGLVDAVADEKDIERYIAESLGQRMSVREGAGGQMENRIWSPARVGVVLVDGAIVDASEGGLPFSTGELASADRIIAAIDELKNDGSVRAVVLRVNSPGGSAFASDRMARAIVRLRQTGKPVIVSMGDVAASGGYYISAPSDQIYASPSTVTGSIGIFGYKIDLQGLLGRVGLNNETYKRGAHADLYSVYRPWTDDEKLIVRDHIRSMYYLFLDTVAAGRRSRGITAERADELGRGRVYTGTQAREVRLVDRIGGVADAIEEAARATGVPLGPGGMPELVVLPRPTPSPLDALRRLGGIDSDERALEHPFGAAARLLAPLIVGPGNGIEARMPFDIETR